QGEPVGRVTFEGMGAGPNATASAVVADMIDIARGADYKPFTIPVAELTARPLAAITQLKTRYYLRLAVIDRTGVLADITSILRDEKISMELFLQHSHQPDDAV